MAFRVVGVFPLVSLGERVVVDLICVKVPHTSKIRFFELGHCYLNRNRLSLMLNVYLQSHLAKEGRSGTPLISSFWLKFQKIINKKK